MNFIVALIAGLAMYFVYVAIYIGPAAIMFAATGSLLAFGLTLVATFYTLSKIW